MQLILVSSLKHSDLYYVYKPINVIMSDYIPNILKSTGAQNGMR